MSSAPFAISGPWNNTDCSDHQLVYNGGNVGQVLPGARGHAGHQARRIRRV